MNSNSKGRPWRPLRSSRRRLGGAATLAALTMMGGGCSSYHSTSATPQPAFVSPSGGVAIDPLEPESAAMSTSALGEPVAVDPEPTPKNVNIFGEFDGV